MKKAFIALVVIILLIVTSAFIYKSMDEELSAAATTYLTLDPQIQKQGSKTYAILKSVKIGEASKIKDLVCKADETGLETWKKFVNENPQILEAYNRLLANGPVVMDLTNMGTGIGSVNSYRNMILIEEAHLCYLKSTNPREYADRLQKSLDLSIQSSQESNPLLMTLISLAITKRFFDNYKLASKDKTALKTYKSFFQNLDAEMMFEKSLKMDAIMLNNTMSDYQFMSAGQNFKYLLDNTYLKIFHANRFRNKMVQRIQAHDFIIPEETKSYGPDSIAIDLNGILFSRLENSKERIKSLVKELAN